MTKRLRRPAVHFSKRQWALIGGVGAAIIVTGLVLFSYLGWQRHERTVQEHQQAAKAATAELITGKAVTHKQVISYYAIFANHKDLMCQHGTLERVYRQAISGAQQLHEHCEATRQLYIEHERNVVDIIQYLHADEELAKVLQAANDDLSKLDTTGYQQRIERWQKAAESIKEVAPTIDAYKPVTDEVEAGIESIIAAYQALSRADESRERPTYDDAIVDLNNAYARLRDSQALADKEAQRVTEALLQSAQVVLAVT